MTFLRTSKKNIGLYIVFCLVFLWILGLLFFHFSKKPKYQEGAITVDFNDNVRYQQAKEIIESAGLLFPPLPTSDPYPYFRSDAMVTVPNPEQFDEIVRIIKTSPSVVSAGPSKQLPQARDKIFIKFASDVTRSQAEAIVQKAGLILESFHHWDSTTISVPRGKEDFYIDILNNHQGVDSADRVEIVRIQN